MFHSLDILRLFRGCVVYEITPLKNDPQKNDMGVKWLYIYIYRLLLNGKLKAKQQTLKVHLLQFKAYNRN